MSLTPHLQPSALVGEMPRQVKQRRNEPPIELGWPGFCPRQPRLVLPIFDDSGSVSLPGGGDPIGNRYQEAQRAFEALREWCSCGKCLAGVLHFDTPRGDVDPGKLRSTSFQGQLASGLRIPRGAAGSSVLGPGLTRAEDIAARFPKHEVRLVVLTDWQLFDTDNVLERLRNFPGTMLAIGLNASLPSPVDGHDIVGLRIAHDDPPGAVARALFGELTVGRRGRRFIATTAIEEATA
ncbi:hypothetical protein [Cryobacterium sp. GrIS_2_6]|uniref:hypothetical protein n=1 Tax=Cryobacterium sp. GrIS_2_6 TaxID=3162785 RepID=UPI002DF90329|nr:hypothetical protein [Cryobacterium psychrotolerans]